MRLLVVIVNYRSADLAIDCLRSLGPEVVALHGTRVVVTDNLSPDDSVAKLSAAITANSWGGWCELKPLPSNGGFAYGNNEGIRPVLASNDPPEYVLLLNPDTVVRPNALKALVDFMDAHPKVGLAGSRLEDPDGTPQRSAFRFHSIASELETSWRIGALSKLLSKSIVAPPVPQEECQTDWVAGASLIVRKAVFDAIGLMDDGYFMYFEEVDFCLRAARAGWPCWYVPSSRVVHLVGQSSGVTSTTKVVKRRPAYWFEARRRFYVKNYGWLKFQLANLAWTSGFSTYRVRQILFGTQSGDPPKLLTDFVRYNYLGMKS